MRFFRRCAVVVTVTAISLMAPALAGASVPGGNVLVRWSIPNARASGLSDITFPLTINRPTAHQTGVYFAQQYSFQHNVMGYTGLQPRADNGSTERLRAVFSVFGPGASTADPNCHAGADTWTGTAVNTRTHIGAYRVPSGSGALQAKQVGFVEYYRPVPACSRLPRADVLFGGPVSGDHNGLSGTTSAGHEYGACVGQSGYRADNTGNSVQVTRGSCPDRRSARQPVPTS